MQYDKIILQDYARMDVANVKDEVAVWRAEH